MKSKNDYTTLLNILHTGILVERIGDNQWMVSVKKRVYTTGGTTFMATEQDKTFMELVQKLDEDDTSITKLSEIAKTNGLELSLKRIAVLMVNAGFKKYKKRQDANRTYFFKG